MPPSDSRAARGLFPRSLAASATTHALILAGGLAWGVLVQGGERAGPRVYALRIDEPRPEPWFDAETEPPAEEPRADETEPVLHSSEVWGEPVTEPEVTAEPVPTPRAVDWLEAPLEIATLPVREPRAVGVVPPPAPRTAGVVPTSDADPSTKAAAPATSAAPADVVVRNPVPLTNPAPAYPRLARRAGEEGSVLCRLHLSADGSVVRVEVVESSGYARLDEAARGALESWRYEPRREDGRPVPTSFLHRVTFRLES